MECFYCKTYWESRVITQRQQLANGKTTVRFFRRCHKGNVDEFTEACEDFQEAKYYHCKLLNERKSLALCSARLKNNCNFKLYKKCRNCKQLEAIDELNQMLAVELFD